jgi:hypothetical protein
LTISREIDERSEAPDWLSRAGSGGFGTSGIGERLRNLRTLGKAFGSAAAAGDSDCKEVRQNRSIRLLP